jgi:hypothetical protein
MSQPQLLKRVIQVLTEAGIDYMVTGSVASSVHGAPRATHDVDIAVVMTLADALQVFEVQRSTLDTNCLNAWSARLGVEAAWRQLQAAYPLD